MFYSSQVSQPKASSSKSTLDRCGNRSAIIQEGFSKFQTTSNMHQSTLQNSVAKGDYSSNTQISFRPLNLVSSQPPLENSAEKMRQLQMAQLQEESLLQSSKHRMHLNMQKAAEKQRNEMLVNNSSRG